ncbi:MAG: NADH-quinone oxidoreductase subunit J [Anaerolineae bacterium]|nr:NADH-quinone oxidoreductase subunit J [Anaerolineae bacterium]MDQ7036717.1 NADH-quinone oxidoreductase subunit J [Anaerolineae bacterium]
MGDASFSLIVAFTVFGILTLGGALGVILNRNLFRGTIWLMISLFGVAGHFVLLSAPFLAAVQVLVYIGAIAILFTFAVMLTRSLTQITDRFTRLWWNLGGAIVLFVVLVGAVIWPVWGGFTPGDDILFANVMSTTDLGIALVDRGSDLRQGFVLPFEVASLLLTAAMIGAIVIAREADDEEKGKRG